MFSPSNERLHFHKDRVAHRSCCHALKYFFLPAPSLFPDHLTSELGIAVEEQKSSGAHN
jgi:hypothetical protein